MNSRILLQGLRDLNELLVGVQGEVDKDPFAAAKFACPATASTEPFVPDVVSELSRDLTTLIEKFNCVHPSLSISPSPWLINTSCGLYRDQLQLPSSNRRYVKST